MQAEVSTSTVSADDESFTDPHHRSFAPAKCRQVARFRRPTTQTKQLVTMFVYRPAFPYKRKAVLRFLNPWVDVAHMAKQDACFGTEVATYTETWGLVSVLLCGLSVTARAGMPCETTRWNNKMIVAVQTKESTVLMSWGFLPSHEHQHDVISLPACRHFLGRLLRWVSPPF